MGSNVDTSVVIVDFRQDMHSNSIEFANVLLSQLRNLCKSMLDKCFYFIRNSSCTFSYNAHSNTLEIIYSVNRLLRKESKILLTLQGSFAKCIISCNITISKKLSRALSSISEISVSTVNCIYLYNAMQIVGSEEVEDE